MEHHFRALAERPFHKMTIDLWTLGRERLAAELPA